MAIGGGSIADLFEERDRAGAMALYVLGPLFGAYIITFAGDIPLIPLHQPGPVLGPIAGGFVAQNLGVKWVFIIIASSSYFFQLSAQPIHPSNFGNQSYVVQDPLSASPFYERHMRL